LIFSIKPGGALSSTRPRQGRDNEYKAAKTSVWGMGKIFIYPVEDVSAFAPAKAEREALYRGRALSQHNTYTVISARIELEPGSEGDLGGDLKR